MKPLDSSLRRVFGALACLLGVLVLAGAGARWVLHRRGPVPSTHEVKDRLLQPTTAPAKAPVSTVADEEKPLPTTPPELAQTADELILSLEQSALAKDDNAAIEAVVRLGARLRSADTRENTRAAVVQSITTSRDAQIVGLLCYILASYDELPEGLLPFLIGSPSIPDILVPALAIAGTLARIPEEWGHDKQTTYWEQLFLENHEFLPDRYEAAMYKMREFLRRGHVVVFPSDVLSTVPRRRLSDLDTIDAILQRALRERELGGWILAILHVSVAVSDEGVANRAAAAWAVDRETRTRRELADWLAEGPRPIANRELSRIYWEETDAENRKQVGFALIVRNSDAGSGPAAFRDLYGREGDEAVRLALVHDVGSLRTDASCEELARLHATGDAAVKAAVEEEAVAHFECDRTENAKKLLLQFGVPIPPPPTLPDWMRPPSEK